MGLFASSGVHAAGDAMAVDLHAYGVAVTGLAAAVGLVSTSLFTRHAEPPDAAAHTAAFLAAGGEGSKPFIAPFERMSAFELGLHEDAMGTARGVHA